MGGMVCAYFITLSENIQVLAKMPLHFKLGTATLYFTRY